MQIPPRILGVLSVVCAFSVMGANFACAQSPNQPVSISQPSHVLVPGEFIQIKVFQEPDLDTSIRIPGDGHVNFPLIGEIALAGKACSRQHA